MKEESLLLLSDLQKLINQVVLIDYTIIILGGNPCLRTLLKSLVSYLHVGR
jgi:organic radical activating enzyme